LAGQRQLYRRAAVGRGAEGGGQEPLA